MKKVLNLAMIMVLLGLSSFALMFSGSLSVPAVAQAQTTDALCILSPNNYRRTRFGGERTRSKIDFVSLTSTLPVW